MEKDEALEKAKNFLEKFYKQYKNDGLLSIYIWGSIITDAYRPGKSDIDTIGIIDSRAKESRFITNKDDLAKMAGIPPKLGFKVLYVDELMTGQPRSWLGRTLHPRLLLLEFPVWIHAAGEKFSRDDFPIVDLSPIQALQHRLKEVDQRYETVKEGSPRAHYFYVKSLYRLCYYVHSLTKSYPFSYAAVINNSDDETNEVITALSSIRKKNWDQKEFEKHHPTLNSFVEKLNKQHS